MEGFRAQGFGLRAFGFRVSGFGLGVSGFGLEVSGFGFRVSGLEFMVQGGEKWKVEEVALFRGRFEYPIRGTECLKQALSPYCSRIPSLRSGSYLSSGK